MYQASLIVSIANLNAPLGSLQQVCRLHKRRKFQRMTGAGK